MFQFFAMEIPFLVFIIIKSIPFSQRFGSKQVLNFLFGRSESGRKKRQKTQIPVPDFSFLIPRKLKTTLTLIQLFGPANKLR